MKEDLCKHIWTEEMHSELEDEGYANRLFAAASIEIKRLQAQLTRYETQAPIVQDALKSALQEVQRLAAARESDRKLLGDFKTMVHKLEAEVARLEGEVKATAERGVDALDMVLEENRRFRDALEITAQQTPEKPDHWSACGQCEHNIDRAQEALEQTKGKQ